MRDLKLEICPWPSPRGRFFRAHIAPCRPRMIRILLLLVEQITCACKRRSAARRKQKYGELPTLRSPLDRQQSDLVYAMASCRQNFDFSLCPARTPGPKAAISRTIM